MKRFSATTLLLVTLLFWAPGTVGAVDPEIGDLVMGQTQTQVGREFYRIFSNSWTAPLGIDVGEILVKEQADPRWGSLISVFVEDQLVYRKILGVRATGMRKEAENAISVVEQHLIRTRLQRQLQSDGDLAKDGY